MTKNLCSAELNKTFDDLADSLVTPERYKHCGMVLLSNVIPIENLRGLYDDGATAWVVD